MRTLITADLHLSANPRDSYRFNFMDRIPKLLKKHDCTTLFVLGDLCETKDFHGAELVNKIADYFQTYSEIAQVLVTRGNHDSTNPEYPFYYFMRHIQNVEWVNAPTADLGYGIGPAMYLPHTSNYKKDWAKIDFKKYKWIFAHNTFKGAEGGFGHILDGIPVDVFPAGSRVISGDIHVPQRLGPVRYVGAPYSVDFGDSYEPRCLLLDGDKLTSIKLGGPQKRLVTADISKDYPKGTPVYNGYEKCNAGDILKVRVTIKREHAPNWSEIKQAVRDWGSKNDFIIDTVQPVITELNQINKMRSVTPKRSDEQLLSEYAQMRGVDDLTMKVGQKLL